MGIGDWGLGIGDWGLGIGPNPQSPIPNPHEPNPQSPILKNNNFILKIKIKLLYKIINFIYHNFKILIYRF